MNPNNNNGFLCSYSNMSDGESYILLHFNSMQAAKKAAFDLLSFLGEPIPQAAEPKEEPPTKLVRKMPRWRPL